MVIDDATRRRPVHVVAHGCERDRLTEISSFVSRGIIGEAVATGKMIATANAAEDPRFLQFESVQRHRLEAVLCVPIRPGGARRRGLTCRASRGAASSCPTTRGSSARSSCSRAC